MSLADDDFRKLNKLSLSKKSINRLNSDINESDLNMVLSNYARFNVRQNKVLLSYVHQFLKSA